MSKDKMLSLQMQTVAAKWQTRFDEFIANATDEGFQRLLESRLGLIRAAYMSGRLTRLNACRKSLWILEALGRNAEAERTIVEIKAMERGENEHD
jgi:hypothetical protein